MKRISVYLAGASLLLVLQWRMHNYVQDNPWGYKLDDLVVLPDSSAHGYSKTDTSNPMHQQNAARSDVALAPIRHIFQYGPPHTAYTTQFHVTCVSLFLHIRAYHPGLLNNTLCALAGSSTNAANPYEYMLQQVNIPQVVKSHVKEPDPLYFNH
jgi:hypothetical protein